MTDSNGFVLHPLTDDGTASTEYPAEDYRMAVGSLQTQTDGTPFGAIQGVRAGSPAPLTECSGLTVTVHPHAGWLCPWGRVYDYALTKDYVLQVPTSTGSYKIALTIDDKAAGHGGGEGLSVKALPSTTPDSQIPGMVIARIDAGVASDVALTLQPDMLITAPSLDRLQTVSGVEGQRARLADGTEYRLRSGVWVPRTHDVTGQCVINTNAWFSVSYLHVELIGGIVFASFRVTRLKSDWTTGEENPLFKVAEGYRPTYMHWLLTDYRNGLYIAIDTAGQLKVGKLGSTVPQNSSYEFSVFWPTI